MHVRAQAMLAAAQTGAMIFTGLGKDFSPHVGAARIDFTLGNLWAIRNAVPKRPNNRADRVLMRFLLRRRAWRGLGANRVSDHRVRRSRVAIIRVAFDEGVIDERG